MIETKISKSTTATCLNCCKVARVEFDRCMAGDSLTEMQSLQSKLSTWERINFGDQEAWVGALGIVEELGELEESYTIEDWLDAIGDILVFATNLCTKMRLDFETILLSADDLDEAEDFRGPIELCGSLCHAILKAEQGIRGYDDVEVARRDIGVCVYQIVRHLYQLKDHSTPDLSEILITVATDVMGRSWTDNPDSGTYDSE